MPGVGYFLPWSSPGRLLFLDQVSTVLIHGRDFRYNFYVAGRVLDPRCDVHDIESGTNRFLHLHYCGMHYEVGWIMYWVAWIAFFVYVAFAIGTTWLLLKAMLWFLPGGNDEE